MGPAASGPLAGVKVVELGSIGPGPFAGMLLSDMGAEVLRLDRSVGVGEMAGTERVTSRGRRAVAVDLKHADGLECALRLVEQADALIDPFRPGVLERLGLGPDACLARNPRLVFGRMTGWGQEGPLAHTAGHDINYIALAGALAHFGRAGEKPTPPINMVGDYGGGGAMLAFGIVCGILEARASGNGQVIDVAMVDGAAALMAIVWGFRALGVWDEALGVNMLDTGAPYYDTYETKDGKFVSIGPIERPFFVELLERTGITADDVETRNDRTAWPAKKDVYTELFLTRTRDEWCELLEGTDACFAPVLPMTEAAQHPHLVARGTIVEVDGVQQPAPVPRFSRTPGAIQGPGVDVGQHTDATLADWGFSTDELAALHASGAIAQA
ncbi:MAG TPA: CaiB/BaiF CoA-transferase family protein [Acidimicrobiia bacterium]|nr:CaiB/BaiF CoA-transferase family protein [Acidimicrobiia bacterium]